MKKKYLPLYYKWIQSGEMPEGGMCDIFNRSLLSHKNDKLFQLMKPDPEEKELLFREGYSSFLWGSGLLRSKIDDHFSKFTPLRQTILLLMAAMNNEL